MRPSGVGKPLRGASLKGSGREARPPPDPPTQLHTGGPLGLKEHRSSPRRRRRGGTAEGRTGPPADQASGKGSDSSAPPGQRMEKAKGCGVSLSTGWLAASRRRCARGYSPASLAGRSDGMRRQRDWHAKLSSMERRTEGRGHEPRRVHGPLRMMPACRNQARTVPLRRRASAGWNRIHRGLRLFSRLSRHGPSSASTASIRR